MPKTKATQALSRRERQIMDLLIEHRDLSAQDVQARLEDAPGYSAVRALLARLVDKGIVKFRQEGAKYIYAPAVPEEQVQESAVSRLIKTFFRGSKANAVKALLDGEGDSMSATEIEDIERTIQKLKRAKQTSKET